jgi:hypothetical protein
MINNKIETKDKKLITKDWLSFFQGFNEYKPMYIIRRFRYREVPSIPQAVRQDYQNQIPAVSTLCRNLTSEVRFVMHISVNFVKSNTKRVK